ncbi:hypothetical protein ONZ45_g13887 [Pleurotus djamor]|nr:hypothetical protein ONZ45_g13887 [Pleurotus djamor]
MSHLSELTGPKPPLTFPQERVTQIEDFVAKYTAMVTPKSSPAVSSPKDGGTASVVLITGSTGILGSHILQNLINDDRVQSVFTLNRMAATPVNERQAISFRKFSLDSSTLSSTKLTSLEGNISEPRLGLDDVTYDKLLDSVTVIIHCAWIMNHKIPVHAFEPLIVGTVNLINFAHESRESSVQFVFASSITAVQNFGCVGQVPDAVLGDARVSLDTGYGEAKHIVEKILASSQLRSCSVRMPQLYLDAWPMTGWLPFLIKSGYNLGQFPAVSGKVDWLPADYTSRFTIEVALGCAEKPQVINVRHPLPVDFPAVLGWIQDAISAKQGGKFSPLPSVPTSSWLASVRRSQIAGMAPQDVPVIKLFEFFVKVAERQEHMDSVPIVGGLPLMDVTAARSINPLLDQLKPLDKETVAGWVGYWIKEEFLPLSIAMPL